MSFNEKHFDAAMRRLERRRAENTAAAEQRQQEIYRKIPEYHDLEIRLARTMPRVVELIMKGGDAKQELAVIEKDHRDTSRLMAELLTKAGYPENYLDPIYTCPLCRDKGNVNNQWCGCFTKLIMEEAARELNESSPLELSSFDSFSLDYYTDKLVPGFRVSEREIMSKNLEYCKSYAENFTVNSEGILMCGATGLGKTHLSLAVASRVLEKGHSVIYGSAPELLHTLEREFYGKSDNDTMETLKGCDLLILDDMGAETSKQLYDSLLYELINARVSRSRPMIVSTNYSAAELREHYDDKITSRLISFHILSFVGSDIRRKLKNKA